MKPPIWEPMLWQTKYRSAAAWVEEEYTKGPKWGWHVSYSCRSNVTKSFDGDGRAGSKEAAQRAALTYVDDAMLGKAPKRRAAK